MSTTHNAVKISLFQTLSGCLDRPLSNFLFILRNPYHEIDHAKRIPQIYNIQFLTLEAIQIEAKAVIGRGWNQAPHPLLYYFYIHI